MNEASRENTATIGVLLVMTAATGIVDAVSYLGLGHVFTANMTGNVALMGFRLAGAPGISLSRSAIALFCFMLGAVVGGRMGRSLDTHRSRVSGLLAEAALLFVAAAISFKASGPSDTNAALLDGTERGRELKLRTPMQRFGLSHELIGAAILLASDAASFITGQCIAVDGGFLASGVNQ